MYLHIRIRPDGNGSIYPGTIPELVKCYNTVRRGFERTSRDFFPQVVAVEVRESGSAYHLQGEADGTFSIIKRTSTGRQLQHGHSYTTFSGAVKRLACLIAKEGGAC